MPTAIPALTFTFLTRMAAGTIMAIILSSSAATANGDIEGVWLNDTGKGAIEIKPCAQSMCGHIVWLKDTVGRDGRPLRDRLNPEPKRRTKPICGLQVIGRLKPQQDGSWDKGWIYDPKQGKAFDVEVKRLSENGLQVKGYLGMKLLSETFVWRRVEGDFARCKVSQ
ncbi:MAG: DUF2147 domain-containing protein [Pseudomonadota bacterium]